MTGNQVWLSVLADENGHEWPPSLKGLKVDLRLSSNISGCAYSASFRTSPVFPLVENYTLPKLSSSQFYFYYFDPAFPVLGRLLDKGSIKLKQQLWYTFGLASILLMTDDSRLNIELQKIVDVPSQQIETWHIKKGIITNVTCRFSKQLAQDDLPEPKIEDYGILPLYMRAIIDEFVSAISLIVPKVAMHTPRELDTFHYMITQINELIVELKYLQDPKEAPPVTLDEYDAEAVKTNPALRETISYQDISRIIQVNSALSYVSTQALSGASPILERRSLVRRHSLLGIGTAILALNRITRSIEIPFATYPIEKIVEDKMVHAAPLPGLENPADYDPSEWANHSAKRWQNETTTRERNPKLAYFSGRLNFRETEYTISAALHSLTCGASLQWSLLTITHEMLHGHVRKLLAQVFQGDPRKIPKAKWDEFYQRYKTHVTVGLKNENELDSVRAAILGYCCLTDTHGSITKRAPRIPARQTQIGGASVMQSARDFNCVSQRKLWHLLENEWKNINEIFTHILDLHYFYGSRIYAYIPLIWRSWAAIPIVRPDLRQYILRSLLTISAKIGGMPYDRFNDAIVRLRDLLADDVTTPVIQEVKLYIADEKLREDMFPSYRASLILVDLVDRVFWLGNIRGMLFGEKLALCQWRPVEGSSEEIFEYFMPVEFTQGVVKKPTAYLLDRMLRQLKKTQSPENIEAETARLMLACSSYSDEEENHGR